MGLISVHLYLLEFYIEKAHYMLDPLKKGGGYFNFE